MKSYVRLQTQVLQHNPLCCVKPSRLLLHKFACVTLDFTNRQRPFMSLRIIRQDSLRLLCFRGIPCCCFCSACTLGGKPQDFLQNLQNFFLQPQVTSTQKMSATGTTAALQYKVTRPAIVTTVRQRFIVSTFCLLASSAWDALWHCCVVLAEYSPPEVGSA